MKDNWPPAVAAFAKLVVSMECDPPGPTAIASLEREIAGRAWARPDEREAAQVLVMRLALLRLKGAAPGPSPHGGENG